MGTIDRFLYSMIARLFFLFSLAVALSFAQSPPIQGKISGGFQAPSTVDPDGRRSVVKGTDATPQGDNIYLITEPRVTSYNPDDSPEMFISAGRCLLDLKSNLAWSDSKLSVKTADGRFALEGSGWRWDPRSSQLVISNAVTALVEKAVLQSGLTNRPAGATNQPVRITSNSFEQEGDNASFSGAVLVRDGSDSLRCARLNLVFLHPGGVQRIEAVQDVELIQGDTQVKSGHAVYELTQNLLTVTKYPSWVAGLREGSAEKLLLNRSSNTLVAEGRVYMKLPLTNVVSTVTNAAPQSTNRFVEILSDRFQFQNASSNTLPHALYTGSVRVSHAEARLLSTELAAHFDAQQRLTRLDAHGSVRIESGESQSFGETANYDLAQEKFTLRGEPRWEMDDNRGESDLLVFYPKTREIHALGDVVMLLPAQAAGGFLNQPAQGSAAASTSPPVRITAETFSHQENISVFNENVKITDARGIMECALMTVITGRSNQVERIVAEGDVRIAQQEMVATGEHADYDVRTGLVHLTGDPRLTGPDKSLRSEAFIINRISNTFSVQPGTFRIEIRAKDRRRAAAQ